MFPKVPQPSQTESLGFPSFPLPLNTLQIRRPSDTEGWPKYPATHKDSSYPPGMLNGRPIFLGGFITTQQQVETAKGWMSCIYIYIYGCFQK